MANRKRGRDISRVTFLLVIIMKTKEFTQENLDLLSGLVLSEMGRLREFGEGRSTEIQKLLDIERLKLLTLYNYLID